MLLEAMQDMFPLQNGIRPSQNGVSGSPDSVVKSSPAVVPLSYKSAFWEYRNEGNQNLTVSAPLSHEVLRLRKVGDSEEDCSAAVTRAHDFACSVMKPLLTPETLNTSWVQAGKLVYINRDDLVRLAADVETSRPAYRQHRGLDLSTRYATLAPDVTGFSTLLDSPYPVFSFELKPKRGFCTVKHISSSESPPPALLCRYCLKQTANSASPRTIPKYCPLRLFSGRRDEMYRAVKSLLTNPRNNLKLFVDGARIPFGGKHSTATLTETDWEEYLGEAVSLVGADYLPGSFLGHLSELIIKALTHDGSDGRIDVDAVEVLNEEEESIFKCAGSDFFGAKSRLSTNCVLGRVLAVQMLDRDGAEARKLALAKFMSSEYYDALESILARGPYSCRLWSKAVACALEELREGVFFGQAKAWDLVPEDAELSSLLEKIIRFQISASGNDCSVFCTFQRISNTSQEAVVRDSGGFVLDTGGAYYACRISIVDVDPKSPSHIIKYAEDTKNGFDALIQRGWLARK